MNQRRQHGVGIAACLLAACSSAPEQPVAAAVDDTSLDPPAIHDTPSANASRSECAWIGVVVPSRRLALATGVAGRVARLRDDIGAALAEGDVVAVIDNAEVAHGILEADAALAGVKAGHTRARSELQHAERRVESGTRLADVGALTDDLLQDDRLGYRRARAELRSATARVRQLEAARDRAQSSAATLEVRAPWSSRIARPRVDIGEWVEVGTALLDIVSDTEPDVLFAVDARAALAMIPGVAVRVQIAESPRSHLAIIRSRAIDIEPGSGAYRIVARLVTADDHVLLGAPAWIETDTHSTGCVLPGVAIDTNVDTTLIDSIE